MRQKSGPQKPAVEQVIKDVRRAARKRHSAEIEAIILELTLDYPANGQMRMANELRKRGHSVSPSGVCGVGAAP